MTAHVLVGMGLVALYVPCVMAALRVYQRRRNPHPEVARKLMHIAGGLIALCFPWLLGGIVPVAIVCGACVVFMLMVKHLRPLKSRLGAVTGNVRRIGHGEVLFPMSVGLLYFIADGDPLLYCVPLLILTFADALAALIGIFYGRLHYRTSEKTKTTEGSLAFLATAFLTTHVGVLLFSDTGRLESLLIGIVLASILTLFEGISWKGLDNVLVPVIGVALLKLFLEMSLCQLLVNLAITVAVIGFFLLWKRRTTLNTGGLLAGVLVVYFCWFAAGWRWAVVPLLLFLTYNLFTPRTAGDDKRVHSVNAMLAVNAPGLLWLAVYLLTDWTASFGPFAYAYGAQYSMIALARTKRARRDRSDTGILAVQVLVGWALFSATLLLLGGFAPLALLQTACGLLGVALATFAFYRTQPNLDTYVNTSGRWFRQAAYGLVGSSPVQGPSPRYFFCFQ